MLGYCDATENGLQPSKRRTTLTMAWYGLVWTYIWLWYVLGKWCYSWKAC